MNNYTTFYRYIPKSASVRDVEATQRTNSSDSEPFEESGDEYVPIDNNSDTDESQSNNSRRGRREENNSNTDENQQNISRKGRKNENKDATRKRKRNNSNWTRNIRKSLKTQGREYTVVSGKKTIPAKQVNAACTCKQKCYEKITPEERQIVFKSFYKLSSSGQNQFLANSIQEHEKHVQRLRQSDQKNSRRNFSRNYFLTNTNGEKFKVCQTMFLNTFDITLKKARVIVEKKRFSNSKICCEDKRGKHGNHRKVTENDKVLIREHINLFPAYQSHYSRTHTQKKYMSSDLSISQMYRLYVDYCKGKNIKPQKVSQYRQIFVEEFNLSFHQPKNDTCAKCDKLAMQLKCCENEIERTLIEDEKNKHLHLADSAYESKKNR